MSQEITPMEKALRAALASEVADMRKRNRPESEVQRVIEGREKSIRLTIAGALASRPKPTPRDPLKPLASEVFAKKFRRPGK